MITPTTNRAGLPNLQAYKHQPRQNLNLGMNNGIHSLKPDEMVRFSGSNTKTQNQAVLDNLQRAKSQNKTLGGIKSFMNKVVSKIGAKVLIQWMSDNAGKFFTIFKEHASHLWDWITDNFDHVVEFVGNVVKKALENCTVM